MRPVTPGVQGGNANTTPSASVAAVAIEFPPHRVGQREALSGLTNFGGPQFDRFGASAGVQNRRISLPLSQYGQLSGFTEANEIFVETALELGERALLIGIRRRQGQALRRRHRFLDDGHRVGGADPGGPAGDPCRLAT